jgi:hypothetical protein
MNMEIWLSKNRDDEFPLPVPPPQIGYKKSNNFEDIILANGDEKTVLSGRNLRTFTLTSFFLPTMASGPIYGAMGLMRARDQMNLFYSYDYVKKIEKWMNELTVLRFKVTKAGINTLVTVRDFTWEEKGGSVGYIDYTLELKEFQPIEIKTIEEVVAPTGGESRPDSSDSSDSSSSKKYTVVSGDSLWKISKQFYGDGSKGNTIYEANKTIIGANPNMIKPGQELVIP